MNVNVYFDVDGTDEDIALFLQKVKSYFTAYKTVEQLNGTFTIAKNSFGAGSNGFSYHFRQVLNNSGCTIDAFVMFISPEHDRSVILRIKKGEAEEAESQFPETKHHADRWNTWEKKRDRINELRNAWLAEHPNAKKSPVEIELNPAQ